MEKTTNATTATAQGKKLSAVFALVLAVLLASTMALSARSAYAADMQAGTFSTTVPDTGDFIVMVQNPSDAAKVTFSGDELTIDGVNATVKTNAQTTQHIVVTNNATITLDGVDINSKSGPAIKFNAGVKATLTLADGSTNTVQGAANYAGVHVGWENGNKAALTINGEGTLAATGGNNSAGIGASYTNKTLDGKSTSCYCGDIVIESGTITANGKGAGIGAANNNGCDAILPTGEARGHSASYKMGCGVFDADKNEWDCNLDFMGCITINGGNITAVGSSGAGIGGANHTDSGRVVINNGVINSSGASGIGCGLGSHTFHVEKGTDKGCGYYYAHVTINGGTVTATASGNDNWGGAGIGGGTYCDATVVINGGDVTANGGNSNHDSLHHGGAAIGGGYEGHASVTITGGDVKANLGTKSSAAAIGSGATPNSNPYRGGDGTKGRDQATGLLHLYETTVSISGGTVVANANPGEKSGYGGAAIGGGVSADKVTVNISGGTVTAIGSLSSEEAMAGGAGIGGGLNATGKAAPGATTENSTYHFDTTVKVIITGGSIKAVGGWGAAGIGSGANNIQAEEITIDTENVTWLEAYADGTKFAIDTRVLNEDGSTTSADNTNITGDILQGTFVKKYENDGETHNTEGLGNITIIPEAASGADGSRDEVLLTGMPAGYRSYAAKVAAPGSYTVYTDDEDLSAGHGRFFSKCASEIWDEEKVVGNNVKYEVESSKLSDNCYLFPVKVVVADKVVLAGDVEGYEYDKDEFLKNINATFYFALVDKATKEYVTDSDGKIQIEPVSVVKGLAQNRAFFMGLQDDHTYDVWEVTEDGTPMQQKSDVNGFYLLMIRTAHGADSTNNAMIGTDENGREIWSDYVTVKNTFIPTFDDESTPQDPKDPEESDDPTTPVVPSTDEPTKPTTTPTTPSTDPATDPTTTPTTNPTTPATTDPTPADSSDTPTTPDDNSGTPADDNEGTPVTKTSRTSSVTPQNVTAPTAATPAAATPAAAAAPAAPAAPAAAPAAAAPAAPAAAAPATTAVADNGNPLASAEPDAESIDEDGNPLAGLFDLDCWVHWWILLGILATAVYSVVVIARRKKNSHTMKKLDKDVLNDDAENPSDSVAARPMNSPVVVA